MAQPFRWNDKARERMGQGANWPGSYWPIRSWERIGPGAKRLRIVCHTWFCTKRTNRRIMQTAPIDSPWSLVCGRRRSWRNSNGVTPTGTPNKVGVGSDRRLSTSILLYHNKKLSCRRKTARRAVLVKSFYVSRAREL